MISYLVMAAAAVVAGVIQSVTGFGSAVFMMLIIPFFFDMVSSSALSATIALALTLSLSWKFRKAIQLELCAFPTVVYLIFSVTAINLIKGMDLEILSLAFGVFLMLLAGYFFLFSERITLSGNRKTAAVCFALSGTTSGLFGIGGPLMALYFVATSKNKESYIANVQFVFAVTGIGNFLTRVVKGVYTVDLIPATLLGFLGILIGKAIGLKILDRLDLKRMKQCVYAFVGISGFITVAEHFLR